MITMFEGIMVIVLVLVLGVAYTALYISLYNSVMKKQSLVEKEYCPTSEDDESEE